jgi:hypothetical protein
VIDATGITALCATGRSSKRFAVAGVADYQIHFLDVWGRIVRTIELECEDDEHARWRLEEQTTGLVPMELWQGERLIERYESDAEEGTSSAES